MVLVTYYQSLWADHTRVCRGMWGFRLYRYNITCVLLGTVHRITPVATAVRRNNPTQAAKELSKLFDELLEFTSTKYKRLQALTSH